jgi:hypothetical protein
VVAILYFPHRTFIESAPCINNSFEFTFILNIVRPTVTVTSLLISNFLQKHYLGPSIIASSYALPSPTGRKPTTVFSLRGTSSPPGLKYYIIHAVRSRMKPKRAPLVQYQSQYRLNQIPAPWLNLDLAQVRQQGRTEPSPIVGRSCSCLDIDPHYYIYCFVVSYSRVHLNPDDNTKSWVIGLLIKSVQST